MPLFFHDSASLLSVDPEPHKTLATDFFPGYFFQSIYHATIIPLLIVALSLAYLSRAPATGEKQPPGFVKFQLTYLCVWTLCVAADWLQGPFVYALYQAYGFARHEIATLFVIGFASSGFFSCFVGSFADRFGRKRCCMAYCVFYIISCATKHFKVFWVLMIGRITGGLATSLLFSSFECWMVSEHLNRHGFSGSLLSSMFRLKYSLMYLVAIVCGFSAQAAADAWKFAPTHPSGDIYWGGNCTPFDLSALVLCIALPFIAFAWEENYGSTAEAAEASNAENRGVIENVKMALNLLISDPNAARLGLLVSCFEGSMYAFVFNWTPALQEKGSESKLPAGLIFSLFMMACMSGASSIGISKAKPVKALLLACLAAFVAFIVSAKYAGSAKASTFCLISFLVFEFCVGTYFPSVGILKSEIVPESVRATMYNIYRVPLNIIVVGLLLPKSLSLTFCFGTCAIFVAIAGIAVAGISAADTRKYSEEVSETKQDV